MLPRGRVPVAYPDEYLEIAADRLLQLSEVLVSHFAPSITDLSASTTNNFLRLNEARKHPQIRLAYLASDLAFAGPNRYRSKQLKTSL